MMDYSTFDGTCSPVKILWDENKFKDPDNVLYVEVSVTEVELFLLELCWAGTFDIEEALYFVIQLIFGHFEQPQ